VSRSRIEGAKGEGGSTSTSTSRIEAVNMSRIEAVNMSRIEGGSTSKIEVERSKIEVLSMSKIEVERSKIEVLSMSKIEGGSMSRIEDTKSAAPNVTLLSSGWLWEKLSAEFLPSEITGVYVSCAYVDLFHLVPH
jgi:hypothetical protein